MQGATVDKATRPVKKGKASGPDWVLEDYDRETTQEPNIEIELRRLQALKSFDLLDRPPEAAFGRFTSLAARLCGTPMALLSLVDLGRTYFVAHTGLASKFGTQRRELPRKTSFCAHAILLRAEHEVLFVPDATLDARFATQSPWVREYGVRFYAGAPLETPEGHRIGCLSVLDDKPRPVLADSLETNDLCAGLQELAAAVMDYMNGKRVALQASSAAGLTVPYDIKRAAVQLRDSLHHLHHDADFNTVASDTHRSLLQSACTTADHLLSSVVASRKQQQSSKGVGSTPSSLELPQHPGTPTNKSFLNSRQNDRAESANGPIDMDLEDDAYTDEAPRHGTSTTLRRPTAQSTAARTDNPQMPPPPSHNPHRSNSSGNGELSQPSPSSQTNNNTVIQISKFVQNLVSAMEVFPKTVHLAFVVDPAVPTEVVCPDDLKVFRSSIALLTSACERTEQGFVRFRVYKKTSSTTHQSMLVFECEDTGRDVELDQYHHLFQTPKHDKDGSESSLAEDDNDDDQECISVDPRTGAILPKAVCQVKKSPISNGFAVYPVARYVEVCVLAVIKRVQRMCFSHFCLARFLRPWAANMVTCPVSLVQSILRKVFPTLVPCFGLVFLLG